MNILCKEPPRPGHLKSTCVTTITIIILLLAFEMIPNAFLLASLITIKTKKGFLVLYQNLKEFSLNIAQIPYSFSLNTDTTIKEKLIHSSFRLKGSVVRSLELEAQKRGVTVSTLVNRTLENYITKEMHFEELGFILVSKGFLRVAFEDLDENRSIDLGREFGLSVAREYILCFFSEVNEENLIKFLDIWFKRFQSYRHVFDNRRHYFFIKHEINWNFSVALKAMLEDLIEPIIKNRVEVKDLTPDVISFSFDTK